MRKWEIFIIQHSHIDIGYTERQELIGDYHYQFLKQAVSFALSPRQCERAEDTKFRFTCEGFWEVEQFLASASEAQIFDFLKAVKIGYIELTAFYAHFTELMDEETTRRMLSYAVNHAKSVNYQLDVAMSCDVNGFCWGMADMLYDAGVRYLMTNINSHHGGYPFDKPFVPFYWETNFKAGCGGFYGFRYALETGEILKDGSEGLRRCRIHNYPPLSFRM